MAATVEVIIECDYCGASEVLSDYVLSDLICERFTNVEDIVIQAICKECWTKEEEEAEPEDEE